MQAVFVPAAGEPATLGDLPVPVPEAGEVLLRVRAAGLNPFDTHIAAGWLEGAIEHRYPLVLGRDASGVVEAIGEAVAGVAVGDEVLAHIPFGDPLEAGTIAEYAILPAANVAQKPEGLDHVSAAALPLPSGAAQAIVDAIGARSGQVVLVNGASGGVGRFVVQLLAQRDVTVLATASPSDADRLRELGATEVIDFTTGTVAEQVRKLHPDGVDALVNLFGHSLDEVPVDALRRGGTVCTLTRTPDDETIAERGLAGGGLIAFPDRAVLDSLAGLAARGDLHVDIARVLPLKDARAALDDIASGAAHGKIVIDMSL